MLTCGISSSGPSPGRSRSGSGRPNGRPDGVADIDAAVTDTHALIYHAGGSARLGRRAAAHFDRAEERRAIVYVPAAVIWEVALLARSARINLRRAPRDFFGDLFTNPAF